MDGQSLPCRLASVCHHRRQPSGPVLDEFSVIEVGLGLRAVARLGTKAMLLSFTTHFPRVDHRRGIFFCVCSRTHSGGAFFGAFAKPAFCPFEPARWAVERPAPPPRLDLRPLAARRHTDLFECGFAERKALGNEKLARSSLRVINGLDVGKVGSDIAITLFQVSGHFPEGDRPINAFRCS